MIGGADLFEITDANGQIRINLTRNDSCEISTCPYTVNESGDEVPICLLMVIMLCLLLPVVLAGHISKKC